VPGSSYFSVDLPVLSQLGSRLDEIGTLVGSSAMFTGVHGAEAYGDLTGAVGDFKDDWDNAVSRIQEQVRGWGSKTTALGSLMASHDAALADSLRPPDAAP